MGRRSRRRTSNPTNTAAPSPPASRIARVRASDETWEDFRTAIGDRSVAEVLGRYVELEVARWQRERAGAADLSDRELADALDRARATTDALERITRRLEVRLHRQF
jgi:hypothetical protein